MKWVKPLTIMAQPKKRVAAMPEMGGIRMAKRPARIRRMLRAMDQPKALGKTAARGLGGVLMIGSPRDIYDRARTSGRGYHGREFR